MRQAILPRCRQGRKWRSLYHQKKFMMSSANINKNSLYDFPQNVNNSLENRGGIRYNKDIILMG